MKLLIIATASLFIFVYSVNAQNNVKKSPKIKYTQPFTVELGGDISFSNVSERWGATGSYNYEHLGTQNLFSVDANAGVFLVPGLKLGIEPGIAITTFEGSNGTYTTTILRLYFSPEYVLYTKSIVYPYLGAAIGYSGRMYSSGYTPTQDGLSYGVRAGIKINFFGNSLFKFGFTYYKENYKYTYEYTSFKTDYKDSYDIVALTAGWSVFF